MTDKKEAAVPGKDTVPAAPMTIWLALPEIMREVAPITKARESPQGFNFRGIDDVYLALNMLLAKYKVSVLNEVLESHHDAFNTSQGKQMFRHRVRIRYTLMAGDGSKVTTDTEGEGMDSGDKATAKAFSTAYKLMAFELFCIPTGDKSADNENEEHEIANERDPDELAEEHRQALVAAKDVPTLRKAAAKIKADHEAKKITDAHRAVLLKVFGEQSNVVKPQNGAAAA